MERRARSTWYLRMGVFLGAPSVMWRGLRRASGPKTVTRLGRLGMLGVQELVSKLGGEFRGTRSGQGGWVSRVTEKGCRPRESWGNRPELS